MIFLGVFVPLWRRRLHRRLSGRASSTGFCSALLTRALLVAISSLQAQTIETGSGGERFLKKHRLLSQPTYGPIVSTPFTSLNAVLPDFQVSEEAGGAAQTMPWIDRGGGLGYILIWQDNRRADGEIWGQLLDADGEKVGKNLLLIEDVRTIITESRIRADANATGDFVVIWSSGYPRYDRPNIFARRFSSDGTPLGDVIPVTQDNGPVNINPDVLLNDNGTFLCVWERTTLSFGASAVWARWFDSAGQPTTDPLEIEKPKAGTSVAVSGSGRGEVVIAWSNDDFRNGKMLAEMRDAAANLLWGPVLLNQSSGAAFSPDIQVDRKGEFVVAWTRFRLFEDPDKFDTFARFFDANGTPKSDEIRLNDVEGFAGYYFDALSLDCLDDGSMFAVWRDSRSRKNEIWGQHIGADVTRIGPNRKLSDEIPARRPTFSALGSHGIVAWEDERRVHSDIFMREFDISSDTVLARSVLVNDDIDDATQYDPEIAVNEEGEAVIAWSDNRDQFSALYLQRLQGRGELVEANERITKATSLTSGPTLDLNNRGDIIVGFSAFCAMASPSYAQLLNFHNPTAYAPFHIAGTCDQGASAAQLFLKEDGSFVATWCESRGFHQPGPKNAVDVFARLHNASGEPASEVIHVNTDTSAGYHWPTRIGGDADGNFLIAWADPRDGGYSIYAQHFDSSGNARGGNLNVSQDTTVTPRVAVAMDAQGNAIIVWLSSRGDSSTIWARRFHQEGQTLHEPVRINSRMPAAKWTTLDLAMSRDGHAVVVWDFEDGQQWDIVGQRLDKTGQLFGENFRVGSPPAGSNQIDPQVALRDDWIYVTWADDRNAEYRGNFDTWAAILDFNDPTTVGLAGEQSMPGNFALYTNYPNPFNPSTTIRYVVAKSVHVRLEVLNLLGEKVRTLVDELKIPGEYAATWDGREDDGLQVASGVYLVTLQAGGYRRTIQAVLIK